MNQGTLTKRIPDEQNKHAKAIQVAIEMMSLYEGGDCEFLTDELIVEELMENLGYSVQDAYGILVTASEFYSHAAYIAS